MESCSPPAQSDPHIPIALESQEWTQEPGDLDQGQSRTAIELTSQDSWPVDRAPTGGEVAHLVRPLGGGFAMGVSSAPAGAGQALVSGTTGSAGLWRTPPVATTPGPVGPELPEQPAPAEISGGETKIQRRACSGGESTDATNRRDDPAGVKGCSQGCSPGAPGRNPWIPVANLAPPRMGRRCVPRLGSSSQRLSLRQRRESPAPSGAGCRLRRSTTGSVRLRRTPSSIEQNDGARESVSRKLLLGDTEQFCAMKAAGSGADASARGDYFFSAKLKERKKETILDHHIARRH